MRRLRMRGVRGTLMLLLLLAVSMLEPEWILAR